MKILASAGLVLCALAGAQSPLNVVPVAPVGYFGWNTPPPISTTLLNINVLQQITLQAIQTPVLSAVGTLGTLEIWLTNPGITTYVGSETTATNWSLAASGQIVGLGTTGSLASLTATSCQSIGGSGLVLNPGPRGMLIRYVGIAPVLAAVGVTQTFSNAELSVSGGALQYTPFTTPVGPQTGYTAWQWRGSILYANGTVPHACAQSANYGNGCYTVGGSMYQEWTDSSPGGAAMAASTALTGRQLGFLFTGPSYLALPGTATFIPPSPTATQLAPVDDGESIIPLTLPLVYPGGAATQLYVHSNGYVSVGSNQTLPGGNNFTPEIGPMLNAPAAAWWSWHDYIPTEAGSGQIVWEEVGTVMVITWNGVESRPTTVANPSTLQFQLDEATGHVTILWQQITAVGGTGVLQGSDHLIGFSPGGESPDTGPFNITTLTSQLLQFPEVFPLTLRVSASPVLGTTINLDTTREPAPGIGVNFLSVGQIPAPGVDLGIIGMPGCAALIDITTAVGSLISNLPGQSMSIAWPLPANPTFAGFQAFSQSVWLDPFANPFGAILSNGVSLVLGLY
jgi:hypothetical protein